MRVVLTLDDGVRPRDNVIDNDDAYFQRAGKRLGLAANLDCGRRRAQVDSRLWLTYQA